MINLPSYCRRYNAESERAFMELRQLETFVAVSQLRSFTRAAEELHLTQPAVTRQIAGLEQELHTRLLERMGRRVDLTPSGEALFRYATEMVRLAGEAERAVEDVATGAAGRLTVGANSTTATYILPRLLKKFREAHSGVELSIHTGVSAQVVEMVIANDVDIGIVTGSQQQPAGLVEMPLTVYATGVVVYPTHPLASRITDSSVPAVSLSASELEGNSLILMEAGTNLRAYVDRLLSTAGVEEQVSMEMDNVEAIKKMIEAGLGISLLPLVSVEAEVAAGRLAAIPLTDVPNAQRSISAIYREDKYLSAALNAFLSLLKSSFEPE